MKLTRTQVGSLLCSLLALAAAAAGCSKSHEDTFAKCPDGIVDNVGEECDDGNLNERDNCPSNCKLPFCGDTIAHVDGNATEQCDFPDLVGNTCASFGLAESTPLPNTKSSLGCTNDCLFDTSKCGPPFTPTPVPTDTPTPTQTQTSTHTPVEGTATPTTTPTPTPTLGECLPDGSMRTVQVAYTAPAGQVVSAVRVLVGFPQGAAALTTPPPLAQRIGNRAPNALVIPNLLPEGLGVLVSRAGTLPQGNLFTVAFDQCTGVPPPPISSFSCSVEECSSSFGPVDGCECSVSDVP